MRGVPNPTQKPTSIPVDHPIITGSQTPGASGSNTRPPVAPGTCRIIGSVGRPRQQTRDVPGNNLDQNN
jgi:hypothetical protein